MAGMTKGEVRFPSRWRRTRTWSCLRADLREVERLSQAPDLAISVHLMTEAEIDEFMDDALAELEEIRIDAKKALGAAH